MKGGQEVTDNQITFFDSVFMIRVIGIHSDW